MGGLRPTEKLGRSEPRASRMRWQGIAGASGELARYMVQLALRAATRGGPRVPCARGRVRSRSAARSARLGVPAAFAERVEHLLECEELQESLDHEDGVPGARS